MSFIAAVNDLCKNCEGAMQSTTLYNDGMRSSQSAHIAYLHTGLQYFQVCHMHIQTNFQVATTQYATVRTVVYDQHDQMLQQSLLGNNCFLVP